MHIMSDEQRLNKLKDACATLNEAAGSQADSRVLLVLQHLVEEIYGPAPSVAQRNAWGGLDFPAQI